MSRLPYMRVLAAAVALGLLALSGCSGGGLAREFGITRDAPDEFTVTTRAPLSMPPDLSLPPPRPGAARPQEQTTKQAAEAALVPQAILQGSQGADLSPGQQALMQAAGPAAPPDIRAQVNEEAAAEASNRSLTDRLMFWRSPPPPGVVVDPAKEAQRLRENAALGQSPQEGDTPIIHRRGGSLFDSIF
jgi:hypothetical protein